MTRGDWGTVARIIVSAWVLWVGLAPSCTPTQIRDYLASDAGASLPPPIGCQDEDGDGFGTGCEAGDDCDDSNSAVNRSVGETCNGLDDDCDGRIDEGFAIGLFCEFSRGDCHAPGITQCNDYFEVECLASELTAPELCNGEDDDCDGLVDEGDPSVGEECDSGELGACSTGRWECLEGGLICSPTADATSEVCNGIDDNCNGQVDEASESTPMTPAPLTEPYYSGPDGTEGEGQCVAGTRQCVDGRMVVVLPQVRPSPETCDQIDSDCDGDIDEGLVGCGCTPLGASQVCYSGLVDTEDVGACHGGTQSCVTNGTAASWGTCTGEVVPGIELCTPAAGMATDEDCDGEVDEDLLFGEQVVELGDSCAFGIGGCRAQGVYACSDDGTVYCTAEPSMPLPEVCNGIDDNCNGQADESPAGGNCTVGVGSCARNGVEVCTGEDLECNVVPGAPIVETCNGVDDDCNGVVDNVLLVGTVHSVGQPCTLSEGVCADDGEWECDGEGGIRCNATPSEPGPEVCDALDNDCDGVVNNGLGVGNLCEGRGTCSDGVWECALNGEVVCSTLEGGSQFDPDDHMEMMHCDDLDNDCNGEVDDYFWDLGQPCNLSCTNVFVEGTYVCRADHFGTVCSVWFGGPEYPTELCDGIDNNCNGPIDEGFGIGTPCGVGACAGVLVCSGPNATVCNGIAPIPETCNGVDDDCDGEIDEGIPGTGLPCDGDDSDLCDEGTMICNGVSVVCSDSSGNNQDLCNGQDDDCNPATANGSGDPAVGAACDGNDADQCNEGVTTCQGGAVVCGDATGDSIEVCNAQDDDCDGTTDEGFNLGAACEGKGECGAGTRECDGVGSVRCSTEDGGSQDQHVPETAAAPYFNCSDGLDNDCDDLVDVAADPNCQ